MELDVWILQWALNVQRNPEASEAVFCASATF